MPCWGTPPRWRPATWRPCPTCGACVFCFWSVGGIGRDGGRRWLIVDGRRPTHLHLFPSIPPHPHPHDSALFKESLRLHPPVTVFSRRTVQDLQLGEYTIPAGWHVGVSVYCLHRHPGLWERPDDFWPERWLQEDPAATHAQEATTTIPAPAAAAVPVRAAAAAVPAAAAAAAAAPAVTPPRRYRNPQEVSTSPSPSHTTPLAAPVSTIPAPPAAAGAFQRPAAVQQRVPSTVMPYEVPEGGVVGGSSGGTGGVGVHGPGKGGPLKSPFQFVPFSSGPRNCIGQRCVSRCVCTCMSRYVMCVRAYTRNARRPHPHKNTKPKPTHSPNTHHPSPPPQKTKHSFALVEASVILARLVRDFDLQLIDTRHTVTPLELLTVRPSRLLCRLSPRTHAPPERAVPAPLPVGLHGSPVKVQAPSP